MMVASRGEPFFKYMAGLLIVIVAGSFGTFIALGKNFAQPMPFMLMVHGGLFLTWYIVFYLQASHIAAGKVAAHILLGQLSIFLVMGMMLAGLLAWHGSWERGFYPDEFDTIEQFAMVNWSDLVAFLLAYGLGLLHRPKPFFHKRFMLIAGLIMLMPATSRAAMILDVPPGVGFLVIVLCFLALVVYDFKRIGKLHKATLFGVLLLIVKTGLVMGYAPSEHWASIVHTLIGYPPTV
ncbi:hypothetical protein GCM10017044_24190 [Kordiimonas sediminis]|uniref:Uncharacterized protein n=1 Tax=Kordiimonas sediminis TaxID=1735581 RepID=A0A919AXJ4_9PROT|nr:hypothetical protein [Kordiimonas sediminis]GHF28163.1 hypothetical protein GCM10017044_24190 [Kordiimonas sediminis]